MKYNLLIVDDDFVNRRVLRGIISGNFSDINIYEAENGYAIDEILNNNEIHIIILDLMMPGKDGFEVLVDLKADILHKKIPVIVNSALGDMENIEKALRLGVIDYFMKPMSPSEMNIVLPLKIKNVLEHYKSQKTIKQLDKKIREELALAKSFQKSLMFKKKQYDDYGIFGKYMTCDDLGGDFYDCVKVRDSIWFIIADVTGHGVTAAIVSSILKGIFNNSIQSRKHPQEVLYDINTTFCSMFEKPAFYISSAFIGIIHDNILYYSNAGHPYPVIINSISKDSSVLELSGSLIGIDDHASYDLQKTALKEGDVIVAYTDGLFNLYGGKPYVDWNNIRKASLNLIDSLKKDPLGFIDNLVDSFRPETVKSFDDDVSVVIIAKSYDN